ncbi:MAG: signal peptide peptidase SppA [Rikenellaceae bacterium]
MGFWKTFWACLLAIITTSLLSFFFSLIVFFVFLAAIFSSESTPVKVSEATVLTVDLSKPIVETVSSDMSQYIDFSSFSMTLPTTLYAAVEAIEKAAIDPKIEGIYIKVPMVMAVSSESLYELREVLKNFKSQAPDKFLVAYGDVYSQGALYLTSVADKVFLNPSGGVSWFGMAVSPMFYKGTLEKLGIEPEVIRHGKFKGAVEPYILDKLSAENRLQYQSLIDSYWNYYLKEIAEARSLSVDVLQKAATNLEVQNAKAAKGIGLVDELYYKDELSAWIEETLGTEDYSTVSLADYSKLSSLNALMNVSKNEIQIIYASGEIVDSGDSDQIVGSKLAKKIEKARKDDKVKAIILRVDSPGGSALASDVIGREMSLAVEQKPVIISMGSYAASGGYWISAVSSKIVAAPNTLTGSIGVFGLLFNAQKGANDILGITVDPVKTNPSADLGSMMRPLTATERQYFQNGVEEVYTNFIERVALGRDMTTQSVDEIGQGRVWSGLQALDNGLIDEIGTLNDAVRIAALEAGIEGDYVVKQASNSNDDFLSVLMQSTQGVLSRIAPSIFGVSMDVSIKEQLETLQGKAQARLPFEFEVIE